MFTFLIIILLASYIVLSFNDIHFIIGFIYISISVQFNNSYCRALSCNRYIKPEINNKQINKLGYKVSGADEREFKVT